MKVSGIYKIQSRIKPERIYIGSAININHRWNAHLNDLKRNEHHSVKLQRHFNKYGESDLQFSILLGCDKEDLIKTEQYFIDSYKPYFNTSPSAGSVTGLKWDEKARVKMIGNKNAFGIKRTDEQNYKRSQSMMGNTNGFKKGTKIMVGRKRSDETKKRMRETRKGADNGFYGKNHSEETRMKMKLAWERRRMNKKDVA